METGNTTPWSVLQGRVRVARWLHGTRGIASLHEAVDQADGQGVLLAVVHDGEDGRRVGGPTGGGPALRLDPPAPPHTAAITPRPPGMPLTRLPRRAPDLAVRHLLLDLADVLEAHARSGRHPGWVQPELVFVDAAGPRRPRITGADVELLPFLHRHVVPLQPRVVRQLFPAPEVQRGAPPSPASAVWSLCAIGTWLITREHPLRYPTLPRSWDGPGDPLAPWLGSRVYEHLLRKGLALAPDRRIDIADLLDGLRAQPTGPPPTTVVPPPLPGLTDHLEIDPGWRRDPRLAGLDPERPDDVQVLVHDGGPRRSTVPPELAWCRITRSHDGFYDAVLISQPLGVRSVAPGDALRFVVPDGSMPAVMATPAYLADRERWEVGRCDTCGSDQALDPPTDLMVDTLGVPRDERNVDVFVAACGWCSVQGRDGRMIVARRPPPAPASRTEIVRGDDGLQVVTRPTPWWEDQQPDPDRYPHGATIAGNRYRVQDLLGGNATAGRFWGLADTGDGVLISISREQRSRLADVAEHLALDVAGMVPLEVVAPLDEPSPDGEQLVALVEMEPAGRTLDRDPLPALQAGPVVGRIARVLQRLLAGGYPMVAVTPETVFVAPDGEVLLAGRADPFLRGARPPPHGGPESSIRLWKHLTLAPELLRGDVAVADEAATTWALSVTAVVATTGRLPFPDSDSVLGEIMTVTSGALREDALADLPPDLADLVRGGLCPDPAGRPPLAAFGALA